MMKNSSIYSITATIIYKLEALSDSAFGKSLLAKLRNSIGKDIEDAIEVWPILFENLPEDFLGDEKRATLEEKSIMRTLQLYALMKQGDSKILIDSNGEEKYKNIGYSLKVLREQQDGSPDRKKGGSVDRRFNALITSSDVEELMNHLRHLLSILKSKSISAYINFPKLAEDIYWYSKGKDDNIRLSWAREYYRKNIEIKKENKGD